MVQVTLLLFARLERSRIHAFHAQIVRVRFCGLSLVFSSVSTTSISKPFFLLYTSSWGLSWEPFANFSVHLIPLLRVPHPVSSRIVLFSGHTKARVVVRCSFVRCTIYIHDDVYAIYGIYDDDVAMFFFLYGTL
ncbi:hypothetical protein P153DRAFT_137775 [Dothidotthia symphoricarpi CBS 119687]|uniref:Uncharacterized protein n=1 Tax=Dothidotthia symphoricarpi CBS 119687 TaxID=1392245 RepID=A0A6A5ZWV8_9PLEO|nr:uncharacterized protein P153DRAFT_137775 [Dothidotthia symphoricarpi CBS 119687]KAF2124242.1 hypothetical protein P153DRAFT_137775 [Dothidotthia symphoricarpi CBS 119687]